MSELSREPALAERYCLFFDLLGSRAIAKDGPQQRIYDVVDLLTSISGIRSTEHVTSEPQSDGSHTISVTPQVSTFSDNIVVSWESRPAPENIHYIRYESLWASVVCKDANRILSGVAEVALRIGVLIRGGFSVGELHHTDQAVFGKAMVDAYHLENKAASAPRVVISQSVIDRLSPEQPEEERAFFKDTDGQWCLNFYREMIKMSGGAERDLDGAIRWKAAHLNTIKNQIKGLRALHSEDGEKRATKWEYFERQFVEATDRYKDHSKTEPQ